MSEQSASTDSGRHPNTILEWTVRILFVGGIVGMIVGIGLGHRTIFATASVAALLSIGLSFLNQRGRGSG